MRRLFFFKLAFLNTFKKKLRVILAISGIALTSSVMIVLFGLQIGLRTLVDNEINSSDSRDVITVNQRNQQLVKLNETQVSKIKSISGVSLVGQSVGLLGNAVYHGINLNTALYAVSPDYFSLSPTKVQKGAVDGQPTNNGVIVSSKVLDVFGIKPDEAIGRKIQLSAVLTSDYASKIESSNLNTNPVEYKIVAVIDRGELPVLFMPIENLKTKGLDSVTQLKVRLTVPEKMATVRDSIEQMGLQTTSIQDTIDQINKLFGVISNALLIFGVIVFLITVSSAFTVISLTLMEETRQIGFLRISGLQHSGVKMLFMVQSIIITFIGAASGAFIGIIVGSILNGFAKVAAGDVTFSGNISVFTIPVQAIIIILMLSVVIGWLVGIIPAKRATLINPLEELRS